MEIMGLEQILRKNYSGKKVFITGHTGFKGAWLVSLLDSMGASVKGYALSPQKNDLYHLIDGNKLCRSETGDIRNEKKLKNTIIKFNPDYIFHLAAQSLVRTSYEKPLYTYEVNALGTANILNAAQGLNKKCSIIIVTTDKVYDNSEKNYFYKEEDRLGGYDPYSASKVCAEIITDSFRNSYSSSLNNKGIASARAGNVIGGGDWSNDRIIPDIIKALQKNKPVVLRNPDSVRPWQHVLDVLCGYLLLGIKLNSAPEKFSSAYNFGPAEKNKMTVEQLTKAAIKSFGKGKYKISKEHVALHEFSTLQLDSSKARKELQWHPAWDSRLSVEKTMEWYKKVFLNKASALSITRNQIENYLQYFIS